VIVGSNRVAAASCFLPLTQNPLILARAGKPASCRNRITEDSDACAIVVSEETGSISFAMDGRIIRHLDGPRLRVLIQAGNGALANRSPSYAEDKAEEERHQREIDEIWPTGAVSRQPTRN
jgi:diadenylate cyclase